MIVSKKVSDACVSEEKELLQKTLKREIGIEKHDICSTKHYTFHNDGGQKYISDDGTTIFVTFTPLELNRIVNVSDPNKFYTLVLDSRLKRVLKGKFLEYEVSTRRGSDRKKLHITKVVDALEEWKEKKKLAKKINQEIGVDVSVDRVASIRQGMEQGKVLIHVQFDKLELKRIFEKPEPKDFYPKVNEKRVKCILDRKIGLPMF